MSNRWHISEKQQNTKTSGVWDLYVSWKKTKIKTFYLAWTNHRWCSNKPVLLIFIMINLIYITGISHVFCWAVTEHLHLQSLLLNITASVSAYRKAHNTWHHGGNITSWISNSINYQVSERYGKSVYLHCTLIMSWCKELTAWSSYCDWRSVLKHYNTSNWWQWYQTPETAHVELLPLCRQHCADIQSSGVVLQQHQGWRAGTAEERRQRDHPNQSVAD